MKNKPTLELKQIKKYFPYHRICLVKVLLLLINGILISNSCNLNKIKKKGSLILGRAINPDSLYTRFIRFFKMKGSEGFVLGILQLVLSMAMPYIGNSYAHHCIAIDRTNWKLGKININILYIGLVLGNGRFIPLYFKLLDKKGNSSQAERLVLFDQFKTIFNILTDMTFVIVGDREFIGQDWFMYLQANYEFVMRIRCKDYAACLAEQLGISVERLTKKIDRGVKKKGYCVFPIELKGKTFYYHICEKRKGDRAYPNEKDKYIRFISTSADHQWVIEQYDRRWKIEVFFEDSKMKGFDLEAINFTHPPKIRLMVAICAICYMLCLIQGIIAYQNRTPRTKMDKRSGKIYHRTSMFTKGYEKVEQMLFHITQLVDMINRLILVHFPINHRVINQKLYGF